ncbi:hypothetical protein, partial [Hymenobacter coccineus]|uniref:hypothetical protein n=1 Tax=Hymenobacter coccineus TaxID=1908235 RepID=UPI0019559C5F
AGPDIYVAQLSGVDGRWQWVSTAGGYGGPGGTGTPFRTTTGADQQLFGAGPLWAAARRAKAWARDQTFTWPS